MKVTLNRDSLLDALSRVQSVVSTKSTIPVLSNVLLEAENGQLRLSATDMELTAVTSVEAEVGLAGRSTLPAKRFHSMIRELPPSTVELEVDDSHNASIRCGGSYFKLMGLPATEYPELPDPETKQSFRLEKEKLRFMLRCVQYAASVDETRFVLNGILFSFKEQKLTTVATDGRRLALSEQELEFPESEEIDMVVPAKAVNELLRNLGDEGEVEISAAGNHVRIQTETLTLMTKLIDGTFPNFRQVIPASCNERIALERESLQAAVRRVALVTNEQSNSIKLHFMENAVEVLSSTPDIGEANEKVPVKYSGPEMTIAYNPEFLTAPLRVLDSDEVYFELTDEMSPGVMKSDVSFLYVIMPMRIQ